VLVDPRLGLEGDVHSAADVQAASQQRAAAREPPVAAGAGEGAVHPREGLGDRLGRRRASNLPAHVTLEVPPQLLQVVLEQRVTLRERLEPDAVIFPEMRGP